MFDKRDQSAKLFIKMIFGVTLRELDVLHSNRSPQDQL